MLKKILFLITLAFSSMSFASSIECKTPMVKSDCPIVMTVTLNDQSVYAEYTLPGQPKAILNWCTEWNNLECYLTGEYKILDGDLLLSDLGKMQVEIKTRKRVASCFQLFGPYACEINK